MALSACVECGRQISTDAVSCPSCGKPHPHQPSVAAAQPAAPMQAMQLTDATDWPVWLALLFVVVFAATCATLGVAWFPLGIPWWIAATVAVTRDAKSRGMDGSAVWMLATLFLGPLGLLVYLLARQSGDLVSCPACDGGRLRTSVACPHCAKGWVARPASAPTPGVAFGERTPMKPEDTQFVLWVIAGAIAMAAICAVAAYFTTSQ